MNINDLPIELLTTILSKVEDTPKLYLVCKLWNELRNLKNRKTIILDNGKIITKQRDTRTKLEMCTWCTDYFAISCSFIINLKSNPQCTCVSDYGDSFGNYKYINEKNMCLFCEPRVNERAELCAKWCDCAVSIFIFDKYVRYKLQVPSLLRTVAFDDLQLARHYRDARIKYIINIIRLEFDKSRHINCIYCFYCWIFKSAPDFVFFPKSGPKRRKSEFNITDFSWSVKYALFSQNLCDKHFCN